MTPEDFKQKNDIVEFASKYMDLRKSGNQYVGVCPNPAHADTDPSLHITPKKQVFHCFGCGSGGTVIDFYMMVEQLTYPQACRALGLEQAIKEPLYDEGFICDFLERKGQGRL